MPRDSLAIHVPQVSSTAREQQAWPLAGSLLRHPRYLIVEMWNWKAAVLSIILRMPIYLGTTFRYGWRAMSMAALVEAVFSAGTAGVYASFTQAMRCAEPQSAVALLVLGVMPSVALALDAALHYLMQTPNLRAGVAVSLAVSIVSSAFNWYSMRRGTLLVGAHSHSFARDLMDFPVLIGRFVAEPFLLVWRRLKLRGSLQMQD